MASVEQIVDVEYDDIRAIFYIEDIPYIGDFILRAGKPDLYHSVVVTLFMVFKGILAENEMR